jgi:hypothetical protein
MHADLDRQVRLDLHAEPARGYEPRIAREGKDASILVSKANVVRSG